MDDAKFRIGQIVASLLSAEANLMLAAVAHVVAYGEAGRGQFLDVCAAVFNSALEASDRMEKRIDQQAESAQEQRKKERS